MTATVNFVNRQSDYQYFFLFKLLLSFSWFNFSIFYFYSLLVHVDYVNYHVVIFMAHLHLNELSLICDMWLNKITYLLLTYILQNEIGDFYELRPLIIKTLKRNDSYLDPLMSFTAFTAASVSLESKYSVTMLS